MPGRAARRERIEEAAQLGRVAVRDDLREELADLQVSAVEDVGVRVDCGAALRGR